MRPCSLLCGALLALPIGLTAQGAPTPAPVVAAAPTKGFWIEYGPIATTAASDPESAFSADLTWKNGVRLYSFSITGIDLPSTNSRVTYALLYGHDYDLNKWFSGRWQVGPGYQVEHVEWTYYPLGGPRSQSDYSSGVAARGRATIEFSGLKYVTWGLRAEAELGTRGGWVGIGSVFGFGLRR